MNTTERMLAVLNESFPDLAAMDPYEARASADARVPVSENLDAVRRALDTQTAAGVGVRAYEPHTRDTAMPTFVFAHGGGYLHGSLQSHDRFCRDFTAHMNAPVVSVDYRLAPDASPLDAVDDMLSGAAWARAEYADERIVVIGDSAGAAIAANAAVALGDAGTSAAGQVLLYPFLDPHGSSDSYRRNGEGFFVTARLLRYYWDQAIGSAEHLRDDPRVNPLLLNDHTNLPPALVVTAGRDPLCDEGAAYASALAAAGTPVVHRRYPDQFHGFATILGYAPGDSARQVLYADIRTAFCNQEVSS